MPTMHAIVLAAGTSSRMEGRQKLVEALAGEPLIARATWAALDSKLDGVTVVLGHEAELVREVVPAEARIVVNERYREGLATSLKVGLASLDSGTDAVAVLLGDMPFVRADHIDRLVDRWSPGRVCVASYQGRRGNPVLWPRELFGEMMELGGDRGARDLMDAHPERVLHVELDEAVTFDVDSPADLEHARLLV